VSEQRFKAARQCDLDCEWGAKGGERCQRKGVFGRPLPCGRDAELDKTPTAPSEQEYVYRLVWVDTDGECKSSKLHTREDETRALAELAKGQSFMTYADLKIERALIGDWERVG